MIATLQGLARGGVTIVPWCVWLAGPVTVLVLTGQASRSTLGDLIATGYSLIAPGWVLAYALFPRRGFAGAIWRAGLSVPLTVASYTGVALGTLLAGLGIGSDLLLTCGTATTCVGMTVAVSRNTLQRRRGGGGESDSDRHAARLLPIVGAALALLILGVGVLTLPERDAQTFVEFGITDADGIAVGGLRHAGSSVQLRTYVRNRGVSEQTFTIVARYLGDEVDLGSQLLSPDGSWVTDVALPVDESAAPFRIDFELHNGGRSGPVRQLHYWVRP